MASLAKEPVDVVLLLDMLTQDMGRESPSTMLRSCAASVPPWWMVPRDPLCQDLVDLIVAAGAHWPNLGVHPGWHVVHRLLGAPRP